MGFRTFLRISASGLVIAAGLLLLGSPASATIYTFVDEQGVIHLTNVPVDKRYRPTERFNINSGRSSSRRVETRSFDAYISRAATLYDVDPMLVKAVIKVESGFDHQAVSKKGAMGLMQLMPETARDMLVRDPFNPEANIMGGTRYLGLLLNRFAGDLKLALAAYNAGPTRVELAQNTVPMIPETISYVERVLRHYHRYRSRAASTQSNTWVKTAAN